jgi:hypothetical protein
MRRWKSLRDRYTREIKKETLPSGSGLPEPGQELKSVSKGLMQH